MTWGRVGALGATLMVAGALTLGAVACGKGANEARPLTVSMDDYKTGTIDLDPRVVDNKEKDSSAFIAYLETKLRTTGALEPSSADTAQMIIRVRPGATTDDDIHVVVDLIDVKTRQTVGQLELATSAEGGKQDAALRRVADDVATYLRAHRKVPIKPSKSAIEATPTWSNVDAGPASIPGVVRSGACTTSCKTDITSSLPPEDLTRVAERLAPTLGQIRVCLDRMNAQSIQPSLIIRFEGGGQPLSLKLDVSGYEDMACIAEARAKVNMPQTTRAASVRCDHRCER